MRRSRNEKQDKLHRFAVLGLSCALCVSLAACGDAEAGRGGYTGGGAASGEIEVETLSAEELHYFTEEFDIPLKSSYCVRVHEDSIYYGNERVVMRYPLSGEAMSFQALSWEEAPGAWSLRQIAFGEEGSIYALVSANVSLTPINVPDYRTFACKFDGEGKLVYAYDLTEDLAQQELGTWSSSWKIEVNSEGRLHMVGSNFIWIFSADGSTKDSFALEGATDFSILDLARAEDGRIYISYSGSYTGKYYIGEINTFFGNEEQEGFTAHQDRVEILGMEATGGGEFLVYDRTAAYRYNMEAGTMTLVCNWQDCGINENKLRYASMTPDGRVVALLYNSVSGGDVYVIDGMTEAEL